MKAVTEDCKIKNLKQSEGGKNPLNFSGDLSRKLNSAGAWLVLEMSYYFLFKLKCEEHNMKERT